MIQSCTSSVYKKVGGKKLLYGRDGAVDSQAHFRSIILQKCQKCLALVMLPCCPRTLSSSKAFLVWPETGWTKDSMWSFVLIWCCAFPILWHLRYFFPHRRWLTMASGQGQRMPPGAVWSKIWQHQYTAQPDELVLLSPLSLQSLGHVGNHNRRTSFQTEPVTKDIIEEIRWQMISE